MHINCGAVLFKLPCFCVVIDGCRLSAEQEMWGRVKWRNSVSCEECSKTTCVIKF